MQSRCSLLYSQEPATFLWPEPDASIHALSFFFLEINVYIILPSAWISKTFSVRLYNQSPVQISVLPDMCHVPHLYHLLLDDHPNNIWQGIQIVSLCIMQFSYPSFACFPFAISIFKAIFIAWQS